MKLIISVVYIPPNLKCEDRKEINNFFIKFYDSLLILHPDNNIILTGDFNHFNASDLILNFNISPSVNLPTRINNTLDQIYISSQIFSNFCTPIIGPPIASSDHQTILLKPQPRYACHEEKNYSTFTDLRNSNITKFINKLKQTNWLHIYATEDIDEKVEIFNKSFKDALNLLPIKTIPQSEKDKAWITPLTKHLIHERWKAFRSNNLPLYQHYKDKVKKEINTAKLLWANKMKSKKSIWDVYKEFSGTNIKAKLHPLIDSISHEYPFKNPADIINNQLSKVFSEKIPLEHELEDDDWHIDITTQDTLQLLQKLRDNQAPGPDGFSAKCIRISAELICNPITHIYNCIVRKRIFPSAWKISAVSPIPKKGKPSVSNIRPISLLPILAKTFEKIISTKMSTSLQTYFGDFQYGFRKNSSTTSAVIHLHNSATTFLENKTENIAIIAFDLSKAFDCVPHNKLITSLKNTSLPRGFIKLIQNYLENRTQFVKIGQLTSNCVPITSGVPQGAIISPTLFNIYMRDTKIDNSIGVLIKYADDSTAVIKLNSKSSYESQINDVINDFTEQCTSLGLKLNKEKTQVLVTDRGRNTDKNNYSTCEINILGISINRKLNFSHHVNNIIKKSSSKFYPLRKLRSVLTQKELYEIYKATIRSLLEYGNCAMIGITKNDEEKLEKVQRRAMRIINPDQTEHMEPLKSRRKKQAVNLYFKAHKSNSNALNHIIPEKLTRSNQFRQPPASTENRLRSFIPFVTKIINKN